MGRIFTEERLPSAEFNIEAVNDALNTVQGLGWDLPADMIKKVGGKAGEMKTVGTTELRMEDTNAQVEAITGGKLKLNE